MKYAILKEGYNEDGNYELVVEQEFESKEVGRVWQTPIIMIYSTKADDYEIMPDEYKKEFSKEQHDKKESDRLLDHSNKIDILSNGSEKEREGIIQGLLEEHRVALKQAGHLDDDHKSHLKTLSEEEVKAELEARASQSEYVKVKEYKTISKGE